MEQAHPVETDAYILYPIAPAEYRFTPAEFESLWALRPETGQVVRMFGKEIPTPRRYNVYGASYAFSGQQNTADPNVPELLRRFLKFGNSVLLNYYEDGEDYIGYHSDNERQLVKNQRVYCFSYGAVRKFKFKHNETKAVLDLVLPNNSFLIMKEKTQNLYKHSLPVMKGVSTRRVSVTIRQMIGTE